MKNTLIALFLLIPIYGWSHDLNDNVHEEGFTESHRIAEWNLVPLYTLEGRAQNLPGRYEELLPGESPMFQTPPADAPLFFGLKPTDRKTDMLTYEQLPREAISIEAWILDHVPSDIGTLIGTINAQDQESGFIIGYRNGEILFGLDGSQDEGMSLLKVNDAEPWKGYWYHVVATYNGSNMKLFVNGELKAESDQQQGNIEYTDNASLDAIGYLENEPYMQVGELVRNVNVYDKALVEHEALHLFERQMEMAEQGLLFGEKFHFTAGPILQYTTQNSVTILWETSHASTGEVQYGSALPLDKSISSDEPKRIHEVTINGLEPNSPYFYNVIVKDHDDIELDSGTLTFQTAVQEDEAYTFVVIGDTEARPHINHQIAKLAWQERPHFMMNCGDLTDGGQKEHKFQWNYEYFISMTPVMSRIPFFPVPGNGESDLYWYSRFHALPDPDGYYTFSFGNADFFMLDSNQSLSPDSKQYQWLEKALSESDAKWKFAAHHHPTFSSDEDDYGNTYEGPSNKGDQNVKNIVPLYEKYGVDVAFFGHLHTYERSWPIKDGKVNTDGGVVYVQTGGGGGNLENAAPTRNWFSNKHYRGHHYCLIHVHDDYFNFKMYDLEGRLRDTFDLTK